MATHSSVLAWRIPGTGEPGWLPSMGLHGVGHDWCDLAAAAYPPLPPVALSWLPALWHLTTLSFIPPIPPSSPGLSSYCVILPQSRGRSCPTLVCHLGDSSPSWISLISSSYLLLSNPCTWVQSLGWEDLLEEGTATHSSILAWRIPMDRGAWKAIVHGVTDSQTWLSD